MGFRRKRSRDGSGEGPRIESVACIDDDGRLCLVRVAGELGIEDMVLEVTAGGHEHRYPPLEPDPEREEDPWADFLLPSRLLAGGSFTLASGDARTELATPERAESMSGTSIEPALIAQLDRLAGQERRLTDLRADLRRQRERAARAEDALEEAESRFEIGLLTQRHEVQVARQEADEARAVVAGGQDREAAAARELAAVQDVLTGERAALQATLESERAAHNEALATERAAHTKALEGVRSAAESEIESLRATAEDEVETARVAARAEVDAARAAAERELQAARESRAPVEQELAAARGHAADAEQSAEVLRKELDESRERALAAANEAADLLRSLEAEKAARAETERRLAESVAEEPVTEDPVAEEPVIEDPVAESPSVTEERPPAPKERPSAEPARPARRSIPPAAGARLIALDMALNGRPRDETAEYLAENFELNELDSLLDDVYARADTPSG